eukprot:318386-Karenia_brevis.AAC.1
MQLCDGPRALGPVISKCNLKLCALDNIDGCDFMMGPWFEGSRVPGVQGSRVPGFKGSRVPRFEGSR